MCPKLASTAGQNVRTHIEAESIMAYVTTTRIAHQDGNRRLAGLFGALKTAIAQRRVYMQTTAELNQLSDRELADLGLSRVNIAEVAHEAAYGK